MKKILLPFLTLLVFPLLLSSCISWSSFYPPEGEDFEQTGQLKKITEGKRALVLIRPAEIWEEKGKQPLDPNPFIHKTTKVIEALFAENNTTVWGGSESRKYLDRKLLDRHAGYESVTVVPVYSGMKMPPELKSVYEKVAGEEYLRFTEETEFTLKEWGHGYGFPNPNALSAMQQDIQKNCPRQRNSDKVSIRDIDRCLSETFPLKKKAAAFLEAKSRAESLLAKEYADFDDVFIVSNTLLDQGPFALTHNHWSYAIGLPYMLISVFSGMTIPNYVYVSGDFSTAVYSKKYRDVFVRKYRDRESYIQGWVALLFFWNKHYMATDTGKIVLERKEGRTKSLLHILQARAREEPPLREPEVQKKSERFVHVGKVFRVYPSGKVVVFPDNPGQLRSGMTLSAGADSHKKLKVTLPSYTRVECKNVKGQWKAGESVFLQVD